MASVKEDATHLSLTSDCERQNQNQVDILASTYPQICRSCKQRYLFWRAGAMHEVLSRSTDKMTILKLSGDSDDVKSCLRLVPNLEFSREPTRRRFLPPSH
ncbi:unnamed protein product [Musa acuminata subsp. burmannicoides]